MLELCGVSGGYGKKMIVRHLSLVVPDGAITAILGPNGCGKSTLLKLLCGQLERKQGDVLVGRKSIADYPRAVLAQQIAYLPQSRAVPDILVETLVLHGRFPWLGTPRVYLKADRALAREAMAQTGILHKAKMPLPSLSGGERQKAYLAMALAQCTPHILLDEPTAYLDIACQLDFLALLQQLKAQGKAVAVVLHDIPMALETADHIAVLQSGSLVAQGTATEILHNGALETAFGVRMVTEPSLRFAPRHMG
ncbi:MAG: ABC transporter ATP-binding protein [Oscillospiraceae bacterium]|jgi:iron complex transport system ATP-binding protein|nr:ABC transporter ATP-binding protein [Oscillospiraceae bacterium]